MRVVSLVPSLTDAVAALGRGDWLVGVTAWCSHGAPDDAVRVRGTKNPHLDGVRALAPDLVLANTEENRREHLAALRADGIEVLETFPRSVADVDGMLADLGAALDATAAADRARADLATAREEVAAVVPATPLHTLTLIWRRPWMGLGPGTYAADLLTACGFGNALTGFTDRYPTLDPAMVLAPQVVLLPSEPYRFTADDVGAVRADLAGAAAAVEFVDGQALTWHGPRTAAALRSFSHLAADLGARLA